jgi:AmpD protein
MLRGARYFVSPNCDDRPAGGVIDLVVIHNISLPPGEYGGAGIVDFFTNRLDPDAHPYYREIAELKVSSHFLIRRAGEIIQFVPCGKRAWHAGVSNWHGRDCCNDFSIGIELEGSDDRLFDDRQYERLTALTHALQTKYPITDIAGHSDIAPGRKSDPGPCFDWARYRELLKHP